MRTQGSKAEKVANSLFGLRYTYVGGEPDLAIGSLALSCKSLKPHPNNFIESFCILQNPETTRSRPRSLFILIPRSIYTILANAKEYALPPNRKVLACCQLA